MSGSLVRLFVRLRVELLGRWWYLDYSRVMWALELPKIWVYSSVIPSFFAGVYLFFVFLNLAYDWLIWRSRLLMKIYTVLTFDGFFPVRSSLELLLSGLEDDYLDYGFVSLLTHPALSTLTIILYHQI